MSVKELSQRSLAYVQVFLPSRKDYNLRYFRQDLLAGLTVSFVALPLALAFGVTSGAGAAAGLYTAVVAGVLAAVFGGSSLQVSGPTGAMTAVLLPIVARYGVGALAWVGLIAGLILIGLALARIGRYINYIPWPVITGFTNGIAIIIFLQQLPNFLGVPKGEGESILEVSYHTFKTFLVAPHFKSILLALITIGVMLFWLRQKRLSAFPASMAALIIGSVVSALPFFHEVARIGLIPSGLPKPQLLLPTIALNDLFRAAIAVALLSAIESLLSATIADSMSGRERHQPDRELFGQGLANLGSSLFGGIPATAALARTAVNVRSGAHTRLAAIIHGLALLVIMLFLNPLARLIPLAVLAGILMVVALRMIETEAVYMIMRSTKSDAFVMLLTMLLTIVFDLILALEFGMVAAGILFIIRMSRMFSIEPENLSKLMKTGDLNGDFIANTPETSADSFHDAILTYRIEGPIFFGAANRFFDELLKVGSEVKVVILQLRNVPVMDATGVTALETLIDRLEKRHIKILLSHLQSQPQSLLERMGVYNRLSHQGVYVFADLASALNYAQQLKL
ncbi:MAG: SulP family inorganic anion transporter [Deinococcales bacterium]